MQHSFEGSDRLWRCRKLLHRALRLPLSATDVALRRAPKLVAVVVVPSEQSAFHEESAPTVEPSEAGAVLQLGRGLLARIQNTLKHPRKLPLDRIRDHLGWLCVVQSSDL